MIDFDSIHRIITTDANIHDAVSIIMLEVMV